MGGEVPRTDDREEGRALIEGPARLASLQVLRGLAALWVVLFHVPWIHVGSFGVDIFFVLSGFIIAHVTARDPRGFAAKRLIRVLPLYWLATLSVFAAARASPALFAATDPSWLNLARSLLFIPYARPDGAVQPLLFLGWTLNYELLFYAVFALALAVDGKRAPLIAVALLIALTIVGLVISPSLTVLHFWTRSVLLEFALGIGVWRFWSNVRVSAPGWFVFGTAAIALALLVVNPVRQLPFNLPIAGLYAAILLWAALLLDARVSWPRWAILIGDASYSLYLLHPYVLNLTDRIHAITPVGVGLIATLAGVVAALAVALLSYGLVELPSQRTLRHWLAR